MTTQSVSQENIFVEPRKRLIDWVRKQLIGPPDPVEDGPDIVGVLPTERFPGGALYPISPAGEGIDPGTDDGGEDDSLPNGTGETKEEPAVVRRYIPPSSLGFSFFIKGENVRFQVLCSAVQYISTVRAPDGRFKNEWTRKILGSSVHENEEFENVACPLKNLRQRFEKLDGSARVDVEWRRFADGWIATISLCNSNEIGDEIKNGKEFVEERAEKTLFEASLRCVIDAGEVGAYPRVDRSLLDEEEQEIELQYSRRHVYAIGHGCAAEWKVESGKVIEIYSDTMPAVEVPQMTADTGARGDSVLSLARLSAIGDMNAGIQPELTAFVDGYANWVSEQKCSISEQSADDHAAANRIVDRMLVAVLRMRTGLDLLSKDARVRLAFSLANRAMLDQMRQNDRLQGKPRGDDAYRWRPFQLAFLLTTLESAANPESDFRDTLDLIWFPTGGGKTEAYLGLIAFQIALRRLRYPDTGGGTTVLMRYTLRLLTRDQFIRATRLICALELIRRERDDLGTEPISVGMWVGDATSPNTFQKATELVARACTTGDKPALVLDHCPWCGDDFKAKHNYDSTEQRFHFLCKNSDCSFGASVTGRLPCNVVDEALYAEPPTMLVATVDKFARLAWEERANAFFGSTRHLPPELIIQDELHLIAGALGSVAGLYEAAVDTVVQSRGLYPKYIASTATIRMASQQVKRLYGRDVAVFPPPGMSCDDSFFARTVPLTQRPGRIYVGYLAPMLNRQACMAPLAAALLLAPNALFGSEQDQRELLDAWWTQMVYHGSLKGVGNSHTAFASAVRDFVRLLSPHSEKDQQAQPDIEQPNCSQTGEQKGSSKRTTPSIAQLTSLQTAEQNADIFARLNRECDEDGCLDAVLATNMISVGLDVGRLGLMIINGQPLTTAEYIQASSRVGRSKVPGVVFANYYRDQARSLSHYESFRPYHDAFYRFVEPTSVTPFTYQARMRALHAALVIVIRHSGRGMLCNDNAGDFNPSDALIAKVIDRLKRRCRQSVSENPGEVDAHIDALVADWQNEVERCRDSRRKLEYQVPDRDTGRDRLLYNHDDRIRGLWPTLQSLRNVENSALLKAL
ncbi:helicase-related protein [Aromatoleum bremense]|uniref:Helicase n=1 Tax=Aromatoleum bremense TaxID=76115 RepID=A0ABX1P076_9RHOO|nr:helicase-related protein [Aromatoleum bremense]NMG17498.1 helicase [Aromatoleum bremense]QTQ33214.1 helicase (C-terminal) domain-containing protein [Aromatoleum bremense]